MHSTLSIPLEHCWRSVRKHLNFYRVHLITFTLTPLIFSAIFYASNGRYHISYIDALFNCVSAMTVCGLATVDLSSLTPWQQVILFIQMCLGSPVFVSWIMVFLRKYYFDKKFEHIVEAAAAPRADSESPTLHQTPLPWYSKVFRRDARHKHSLEKDEGSDDNSDHRSLRKLRTDMIRRMDDAPKLVDPNGWISEGRAAPLRSISTKHSTDDNVRHLSFVTSSSENYPQSIQTDTPRLSRRLSDPGTPSRQSSLRNVPIHRYQTIGLGTIGVEVPPPRPSPPLRIPSQQRLRAMPRTQTVEFAPNPRRREHLAPDTISELPILEDYRSANRTSLHPHPSLPTFTTQHTYKSARTKHSGFGGFPMPHEIIARLVRIFFPKLQRKLTRTVTIPATTTIASQRGGRSITGAKVVPYISFDAVVGRNSAFQYLTSNQIEELGGVEYRALNALLWIIGAYHIGLQLIGITIVAPYISRSRWDVQFEPPALHRPLNSTWYSVFQVVSAYTNTGMSLVDTSMIPFRTAYPMIFVMIFLILAGNTAFPIFLRFTIWILTKLVPKNSRANETLHFLLDHPRRCFIYLFPSHQTWFLLTVVVFLNFTDWFFFMVLDIGTPAIEAIPVGIRFVIGLLQASAVRAAGFATVSIAALAPAVKVLFITMMYVSVYPIAMSVRSTNVYEEQSLGVYQEDDESDDEYDFQAVGPRMTVWSRYLAMHARKQLAFDMWWLGVALFLICIIERSEIEDSDSLQWFNIFTIIFELVSGYGTVGLSLGLPRANYSLSGAFRTLSKLILCLVMIRGRHRGLPVAIDRAVMFPSEFKKEEAGASEEDDKPGPLNETHSMRTNGIGDEENSMAGQSFDLRHRPHTGTRRMSILQRSPTRHPVSSGSVVSS